MELQNSVLFDPSAEEESFFDLFKQDPAVFALFPADVTTPAATPYLGRTADLRRRLRRLLRATQGTSRLLNLRAITRRIQYQYVGSAFEAQWLLYRLHRHHYPQHYRARLRLRPPAMLKLNLSNRFPRCYPTRRISNDGSLYYGPFSSRATAERFAAEFLDLFKIRRCVEELHPDPAHPGCLYSQMRMCLAPCFQGCSDDEYHGEVERVVEFMATEGQSLARTLEVERDRASETLDFERAAGIHRKIDRVHEVLRLKPDAVRNLRDFHAVIIVPGAGPKTVSFFIVCSGELRGPASLSLSENVASSLPLDEQFRRLFEPLLSSTGGATDAPLWEHLSLFSKWYYSSFRQGELLMLPSSAEIPYRRLIRICRKIVATSSNPMLKHP